MNAIKIPTYTPPKKLIASLRSYQHEGYNWLRFLYRHELGGILADDMGLGKTIQKIALFLAEHQSEQQPFLVIAPTSVVENWDMEMEKFAPSLKRIVLRRGDRSEGYKQLPNADVVIISYALARRDAEQLQKQEFAAMVLDEAQFVKNHQSKQYAEIRKIPARRRYALTGTPLENTVMELWSICSIVAPGLFPSPEKFREQYQIPIEKHQNAEVLAQLRQRIKPFLLRRTKEMVDAQLPKKTETTQCIELHPKHRKTYDVHLQRERKKVLGLLDSGGLQQNRFQVLQSLTRLRQLALHPALLNESNSSSIPSSKMSILQEQIETIIGEGHKILVVSQFTKLLYHVQEVLKKQQIDFCYLDGSTVNRKQVMQQFQEDDGPQVFVMSLKAGGVGLNLTAANYCIMLDPWWNPAVEQQAIDRTHRNGQTKNVFVYKYIAKDTIEEKVLALQKKKRELFQNVLDETGGTFGKGITESDIRSLFS